MDRTTILEKAFEDIQDANVCVADYCGLFYASINFGAVEFVQIVQKKGDYEVFINNPYCKVDENGFMIFDDEHPEQQWVFGRYESLEQAIYKAKEIVIAREYPKPIEIWK